MSRLARRAGSGRLLSLGFAALVAASTAACSNADDGGKQSVAGTGASAGSGSVGAGAGGAPVSNAGTGSGGSAMSSGAGRSMGGRVGSGGRAGSTAGGGGSAGSEPGAGGRGGSPAGGEGGTPDMPDPDAGAAGMGMPAGTPTLYWLDVGGKVLRSSVTPFSMQTLVPSAGQGPDGIAVDLEGGHVYWTNMGVPADDDGSLRRSNLDGSNMITIVPEGGTYTPKQLKLEPTTQKLYWSDREGMRVQRANLDGSEIETLYTSGTGAQDRQDLSLHCVGIAVDQAGGFFYWSQKGPSNGHVGSLRRAHLELPSGETSESRSDVEILYDGLPEPIDIDLDLEAGFIYWTDRGDDTVNRGPIEIPSGSTAANRTDREILVPGVSEAIGLVIDRERGLVYYTDAVGGVGRVKLDGTGAEPLLADAGAFTGIAVVDLP